MQLEEIREMKLRTAESDHLARGLDYWLATKVALPELLIRKGIFTENEWQTAIEQAQEEIAQVKAPYNS